MATARSPHAPRRWARVAVAALVAWVVIDALRTVLAVGDYEDRISIVNHDSPDLVLPWWVYTLSGQFVPHGMVTTVAARLWMAGLLVAGAAFVIWLVQARRHAGRLGGALARAPRWTVGAWFTLLVNLPIRYRVVGDVRWASGPSPRARAIAVTAPVGRWWACVILVVFLNWLAALYSVLTSHGGVWKGQALDTRLVAYPLWVSGTVALVAAAVFGARVVLRVTEAQQRAWPDRC